MLNSLNLKIAYVTAADPLDKNSWSGTHYYIVQALRKYCGEVVLLGPIKDRYELFVKAINKISQLVLKKKFKYTHRIQLSKTYAKVIKQKLIKDKFDIIFAPAASTEIASLDTTIPVIYLSDTTFSNMVQYYSGFSNLLKVSVKEGNLIEQKAIEKADILLYPSQWAAESAAKDYKADINRISVIPFGANLDFIPSSGEVLNKRKGDICKLLFVGKDWDRKGGDIAFKTLLRLLDFGMNVELVVCGCKPPIDVSHKNIKFIPFLNKNIKEEARLLNDLYLDSDFFILPTRAECASIVFCEANAFGLPVIATNTGGVASFIKNGVNGYLLPFSAGGEDYAKVILSFYNNDQKYYELRKNSREEYDKRLNWDAWGKLVSGIIVNKLRN